MSAPLAALIVATLAARLEAGSSTPHIHAVVQLYREGVAEIGGGSVFRRYTKDAQLSPGPGSSFAIVDGATVVTYDGLRRRSAIKFGDPAWVIGWSGAWPVVSWKERAYLTMNGRRTPLSKSVANCREIAGDTGIGFFCALKCQRGDGEAVGYRRYGFLRGRSFSIYTPLGKGAGSFVGQGDDVLVGTDSDWDYVGDMPRAKVDARLWRVALKDGSRRLLAQLPRTDWYVTWPDTRGRCWITAQRYRDWETKFHDFSTIWKYTEAKGLERIASGPGEFTAFGIDSTGRWLIGQHLYGYEMGAYDLVARSLKTSREVAILHGVEEFQWL